MRKKLLPLGRLFESAWYNPILKAVPMSMGILMSGNAGYAIAGNMSDNVVIVQQQTISVTGTVIDASGEPLVGVNIVEAGTVNGVISDFEGKFTLNVKPNATLKISYIGYIAQNILVKGQKNLTIKPYRKILRLWMKWLWWVMVQYVRLTWQVRFPFWIAGILRTSPLLK